MEDIPNNMTVLFTQECFGDNLSINIDSFTDESELLYITAPYSNNSITNLQYWNSSKEFRTICKDSNNFYSKHGKDTLFVFHYKPTDIKKNIETLCEHRKLFWEKTKAGKAPVKTEEFHSWFKGKYGESSCIWINAFHSTVILGNIEDNKKIMAKLKTGYDAPYEMIYSLLKPEFHQNVLYEEKKRKKVSIQDFISKPKFINY